MAGLPTRPAVNVATTTTYRLLNPNGWTWFHSATTTLAVSHVDLACDAHLASASDSGVAVLGSDETNGGDGGVVVLGRFEVRRVCQD